MPCLLANRALREDIFYQVLKRMGIEYTHRIMAHQNPIIGCIDYYSMGYADYKVAAFLPLCFSRSC